MLTNGLIISSSYVLLIDELGESDHQINKNLLEDWTKLMETTLICKLINN